MEPPLPGESLEEWNDGILGILGRIKNSRKKDYCF
jgi:hypothetical protein